MQRFVPIISLAVFVLIILGIVFVWMPGYDNFSKLSQDLATKQIAAKQKQDYFAGLNAISQQLQENQEAVSKADSALADRPDLPDILNFVQQTASANNLSLKIVDFKTPPQQVLKPGIQNLNFSVTVSGNYSDFKNFLASVYKNSRLVEILSTKFSSPEGKTSTFDFNLLLSAHYFSK